MCGGSEVSECFRHHFLTLLLYICRVYGLFTLETLIATAFGRYVDLQRGEADQLTEAAAEFFRATLEESSFSPDALLVLLCKCLNGVYVCVHVCVLRA